MLDLMLGIETKSVRRSKRLHWTMMEARQEMEGWVCELGLGKISWDTVADDVIVARVPGHIAVMSCIYLPIGDPPTLNATEIIRGTNGHIAPDIVTSPRAGALRVRRDEAALVTGVSGVRY